MHKNIANPKNVLKMGVGIYLNTAFRAISPAFSLK